MLVGLYISSESDVATSEQDNQYTSAIERKGVEITYSNTASRGIESDIPAIAKGRTSKQRTGAGIDVTGRASNAKTAAIKVESTIENDADLTGINVTRGLESDITAIVTTGRVENSRGSIDRTLFTNQRDWPTIEVST